MDKTDAEIVNAILGGAETVKNICEKLFGSLNEYQFRKKSSFLRYRLSHLIDMGILQCVKSGMKHRYTVPLESLIYGEATMIIKRGKEEMSIDLGSVIVTDEESEEFNIIFLDR